DRVLIAVDIDISITQDLPSVFMKTVILSNNVVTLTLRSLVATNPKKFTKRPRRWRRNSARWILTVDGIASNIYVVVCAAAFDGVSGEEAAEVGAVWACAHVDDGREAGGVVGGFAGLAEVAEVVVAAVGVESGAFAPGGEGGGGADAGSGGVGLGDDVAVEVG